MHGDARINVPLRELFTKFRMAQRKQFELYLQQQGLRVADLFNNVPVHGCNTLLLPRHLLQALTHLARLLGHRPRAERQKNLGLVCKVGIEGATASTRFDRDVLYTGGFEAIPGKNFFCGGEQSGPGTLCAQRLLPRSLSQIFDLEILTLFRHLFEPPDTS